MGSSTRDQVHEALDLQQTKKIPIGQLLIELGYATDDQVNMALAAQSGMEVVELANLELEEDVIKQLPAETAQAYQVVPIAYEADSNALTIAMKSADNFRAIDDLQMLMGFTVKAVVGSPKDLDDLLMRHYGEDNESISALLEEMAGDDKLSELQDRGQSIDLDELASAADDNKVKRLLNLVLLQAIKDRASDIHFEPFEFDYKMRYRIDGVLYEMIPPPKHLAYAISSRVKVMSNLDIAERRLPQDGRVELMVQGRQVDLRVSILPTIFGEAVVLRVLDRSNVDMDIEKIGLRSEELATTNQLMHKPNGIVIVTGPTGSGKTTTLYAALNSLNTPSEKLLTVEDPVEYDVEGLIQVQVDAKIGMTFARALRSFLRQDPDIILVGEIRDLETAQISVQAALTGHLVFSTLHTNDAPSSIARLLDLGLEPFLVTATLEGIVAQRLVRRICLRCREQYEPTEEQLMELNMTLDDVEGRRFSRGRGCDNCNQTGYTGRMALFEIMVVDDEIKDLVMQNASTGILRNEARKRGMRTLRQGGLLSIYDGITTIDEVVRETISEDE
jgi:type IV pilus assembly protein PilB